MPLERWQTVSQLYHAALAVEASQRAAFVDKACGGDAALQQEVESLLAEAQGGDSFLEAPAMKVVAEVLADGAGERPIPTTIGRYRVVRLLGEGGMGAVYEAEQDQPRRTVALKVIKPGFATAETLRRFQHESQALGRLQHPGIAQIYEASTADTGFGPQPYFAMELIRGLPLHEYAEVHKLPARDRLALIARVCDAVDHAHQRGVIHRDLKPGNILVDETGQPKILDFGVARVTESDAQHTRQTDLGQLVGTLAYMSPEQVAGDPAALDSRSDVYALGVILYELLAGKLPYDIDRKPLHEAVAVIREEEPAALSSIDRHYRGDIETVVAKALEKDKTRRYASAAELAGDIRFYLADEPITARPASATYQLQKFARRHKALVAGTAAVFAVLAAGVVASTWEAMRARTAEATAEAVNDFLRNDLLAQASTANQSGQGAKPDPNLRVRTALDRAASQISGKFNKQPAVEAAIRDTIAGTYMDLGLYPEAQKQWERALDLDRRTLGSNNPTTLKTLSRLGRVAFQQGRYGDAERLLSEALRTQRRVLPPGDRDLLYTISKLAQYYLEKNLQRAEAMLREVVDVGGRVLGPEHPDVLTAKTDLAYIYFQQGKFAQSESLHRQTIEIRRRLLGPEHPDTLGSMHNLGTVYCRQGKYAQAEVLYNQVLENRQRLLGPEHPDTLASINNLANLYYAQDRLEKAEQLDRQALDIRRRLFRHEHGETVMTLHNLALVYRSEGKYAQAEGVYKELLDIEGHCCPDIPTSGLESISNLALMCQRQGHYALAESYAARALEGYRRTLGSKDWRTMEVASALALACQSQGESARSEPFAREAFEYYRSARPRDWRRFRDEVLLGVSLARQKKFTEAGPLLVEGYRGMVARRSPVWLRHLVGQWVSQAYRAWGKKSPLDGCGQWIVDGLGTMLPENFQPLPNGSVLVLGSNGGLWLDLPPFGEAAPKRIQVDDNVQAFHTAEDKRGSVFALGSDGKLWQEYPPFETIPPERTEIDAEVIAFQPTKNGSLFVLDKDSILWYEHPPFGTVPPLRSKVSAAVRGFQATGANSLAILRTDGTLWITSGPFGESAPGPIEVDRGVLSFQPVADGTGSLYVRDNGCRLWLESPPFGEFPPKRVQVDADAAFVAPVDRMDAYVLDNSGNVWRETAPFSNRTRVDRNAAYLQTEGHSKLYVLDNQGDLWLEFGQSGNAQVKRVQVDRALFRDVERFSMKNFVWDVY